MSRIKGIMLLSAYLQNGLLSLMAKLALSKLLAAKAKLALPSCQLNTDILSPL